MIGKHSPPQALRLQEQPVVSANSVPGYGPIFNAGAIYHDGRYHLFARAVRDGYRRNEQAVPRYLNYISDLLVFTSCDGLDYAFQQVLHVSEPEAIYEDPRVQLVWSDGQPHFLLSYTTVPLLESGRPWRAALRELGYANGSFSLGRELVLGPEDVKNKDVVLCNLADGRVALIQRLEQEHWPEQTIQLFSFASLEELWATTPTFWRPAMDSLSEHMIITPRSGCRGVGAGAPPLLVDGELVFFYHERGPDNSYTTQVALLDQRTGRVRALLEEPILSPELPWEISGDVDNVIFVQGAILRGDGTIYLSYGAADRSVGAAAIEAAPLLAALRARSATVAI
jgi:predicted GH43/DUF377 family glycosyl hydrolase